VLCRSSKVFSIRKEEKAKGKDEWFVRRRLLGLGVGVRVRLRIRVRVRVRLRVSVG
jgi:hypothetical protein